jgi:hypothetical protein
MNEKGWVVEIMKEREWQIKEGRWGGGKQERGEM